MAYRMNTTPDWQLDMMYETESDRMWEVMNAREDEWNKKLDAVGFINVALEQLDKATDSLVGAKDAVKNLPAEDRIASLISDFEDLVCDLNSLRQKFINGEG